MKLRVFAVPNVCTFCASNISFLAPYPAGEGWGEENQKPKFEQKFGYIMASFARNSK
jgi:hypothetical protein